MMQRDVFMLPSGPMLLANRESDAEYKGQVLERPDKALTLANKRSMHSVLPSRYLER